MLKFILIFPFCIILMNPSKALVEPPNYDFSIDTLLFFEPGKKMSEIDAKYPQNKLVKSNNFSIIKRYEITHIRYKFPIFVQYEGEVAVDFYARLPDYFLHNIFHESLIHRFKKQTLYKKVEEQAVYIWKNEDGTTITYAGGCTITCFPIYLSISLQNQKSETILKQMNESRLKI